MPQMYPMMWLYLYFNIFLLFIIFMIINYFFLKIKLNKKKLVSLKKINFNLKW